MGGKVLPGSGSSEGAAELIGDGSPIKASWIADCEDDEEEVLLLSIIPDDTVSVWLTFRHC
jgi:hypothetical protein